MAVARHTRESIMQSRRRLGKMEKWEVEEQEVARLSSSKHQRSRRARGSGCVLMMLQQQQLLLKVPVVKVETIRACFCEHLGDGENFNSTFTLKHTDR